MVIIILLVLTSRPNTGLQRRGFEISTIKRGPLKYIPGGILLQKIGGPRKWGFLHSEAKSACYLMSLFLQGLTGTPTLNPPSSFRSAPVLVKCITFYVTKAWLLLFLKKLKEKKPYWVRLLTFPTLLFCMLQLQLQLAQLGTCKTGILC